MDTRRKRLIYRANRRGMTETDRLLGAFATRFAETLSEDEIARFEDLLEQSDHDLLAWIGRREKVPDAFDDALMARIIDFANTQ